MSMIKKVKKGFTLIELVVVIAVIAVLSAVSVVTYISITNKAKQSNDQLLVDQVNRSILSSEILKGKRNTVHDVVEGLEEDGFKIDNLKAEAKDYRFAYAMEENKFVIVEKDNKVVYPKDAKSSKSVDLWIFTDKTSGNPEGYSYYLKGDSLTGEVSINGGLDVGNNTGISSINYSHTGSAQKVIIRTNSVGTTLTINAAADTVDHYGSVGKVDVQKIDLDHCYNEYGKAAYVRLSEGKVVAKAGGTISVVFAANNDKDAVAVLKENQGIIEKGLTVIQPVSDTNEQRTNGIPLEYSVDGTTAASSTFNYDLALESREAAVNEVAEEAIDELASEEVADMNKNGANYVARIGASYFETFKEALTANTSNKTITLVKDCYIDENIGNSQLEGALNCKVALDKELTITFKNNAQVFMTNACEFELNDHILNIYFDSSCNNTDFSGFMNCSLADAYHGLYQQYWGYRFADNSPLANVYVDFQGIESYAHLNLGLVYNHTDGLILGPSGSTNLQYDDEQADYVYINDELQGSSHSYGLPLYSLEDNTARLYVEAGGSNYVWKVTKNGVASNEMFISDGDNHGNWVQVTVSSTANVSYGAYFDVEVTFERANGDDVKVIFGFYVKQTQGMGGGEENWF